MRAAWPPSVRRAGLGALALTALALPESAGAQDLGAPPPRSWFALDADVGLMLPIGGWTPRFHARARAGYSRVVDWHFWDATLTAEHLTHGRTAFGVMGTVTSITYGWSASVGATLSTELRPGATLAVGFSLIRLEAQILFDDHTEVWLGAGIRIPLGAIGYAVWVPPLHYRMPAL